MVGFILVVLAQFLRGVTRKALLSAVYSRASPAPNLEKILRAITMEQLVLVNPNVTFAVDLAERIEVQLLTQGGERMLEKLITLVQRILHSS